MLSRVFAVMVMVIRCGVHCSRTIHITTSSLGEKSACGASGGPLLFSLTIPHSFIRQYFRIQHLGITDMWETDLMNAKAAATIYANILWKGICAKARAEAWHLPYPWELKICSSEGFRKGWPLQLLRGSDKIIYLPDGRFQPYSGIPDAYLRKLWEF